MTVAEEETETASREVIVQSPERRSDLATGEVRSWLRDLLESIAPERGGLTVRLTDDEEIRRLNREYRGRDEATDVLSCPGQDSPEGPYLGDVVISVPTAKRQAERGGRELVTEIRVLSLHGILHCLGYDHETDDGTMERLESRLRSEWVEGEDG